MCGLWFVVVDCVDCIVGFFQYYCQIIDVIVGFDEYQCVFLFVLCYQMYEQVWFVLFVDCYYLLFDFVGCGVGCVDVDIDWVVQNVCCYCVDFVGECGGEQ